MKIKAEKWIADSEESYKILKQENCCDGLIKNRNIVLNDNYCSIDYKYDYSVKLEDSEYDDEMGYNYSYEKINFCPFCGSKIEIEIVNKIDKTEEYKGLSEERDKIWKKYIKTDSKKREQILKLQAYELDNKINKILESDGFIKNN